MGVEVASYSSKSKPGKNYHIFEAADGTHYCDCWQWKRNRTCSHLEDFESNGGTKHVAQPVKPVENPTEVDKTIDDIINGFFRIV